MSFFNDRTQMTVSNNVQNSVFVIMLTVMFWMFFSNGRNGCSLLYARRHTRGARLYVPVLNIVPNLIGAIICAYVAVQRAWPGFANCSTITALDAFEIALGTTSIVGILFIRVYYAWMRHRWLLFLGSTLIFANFIVGTVSFFAMPVHADENGTCIMVTEAYWPLTKFITDIITNLTLSGLYLYVLSRAFHAGFSTTLYAELRHEGFIATFLVIVSSTATAVIVLLDLVPGNAPYIYGVDTLINATLISRMLCRRHNSGSYTRTTLKLQTMGNTSG
ncbi:hypothetical protein THASP1DRAFT_30967 [Thamnocephalis sphaerospora]|uniref:Integral membrane protein n=1 Tax=Thamnocephalis sphaerospora TaxID=78915 RepID=A0A4V1IWD9_9FUNG|nr:hypothetical protein THASP1DRAFT_30967 [Thamnocephalis sphaerospora]|eukprot:RKP07219.1 hypothetical protein THASP1DRAFT_30967 [Thamnocephalis sphaerospora]